MIETIITGGIQIVKLNKQPTNSLDLHFLQELYSYLLEIEKQKKIKGVVLVSGCKSIFSSGLDLRNLVNHSGKYSRMNIIKAVWFVYRIVILIIRSNKIYTASISGAVIGSAVSIILACDFRLASENVWFWIPDPQYGGLLVDGGIDIIRNICGIANTKRVCLTNERIEAKAAKEIGLVHNIGESANMENYSIDFTANLLNYSRLTLQHTKAIINKSVIKHFHIIRLLRVVYSKEMLKRLRKYNLLGGTNEFTK